VHAGSIIYVAKNMDHHFHSIEEELTVLVFFAPAEYSNK
jgi:quercetin dioxygenase-like cupin family protein